MEYFDSNQKISSNFTITEKYSPVIIPPYLPLLVFANTIIDRALTLLDTRGRYVAKTEVILVADREIDYKLVFKSVSRGRSATLASL